MRVVLLGAPGSGKGTQAKLLMEEHKVPQISTGDLLRVAIRNKTALGEAARAAVEAGQLVPNEVVLGIISERLTAEDAADGFILDGFPRNIDQARALDEMLRDMGKPLQLAILLEVDADILLQRLTGRRTCIGCGAVYNVYTSPPKIEDRCDDCGDVLKHRPDDNETTIEQRLRIFQMQTRPLASYYREQGKLRTIQAIGDISDIYAGISKLVNQIDQMAVVDISPAEVGDEIVNAPSAVVTEPLPPVVLPEVEKKPLRSRANTKAELADESSEGDGVRKKAVKKPAVKKAAASKKKTVKKALPKKKAPAKKPTVKKAAASKKKVAKKKTAKKTLVKQSVLKKKSPKKTVAKKKAAKKKTVKKSAVKKATTRTTPKKAIKKVAAKKKTAKKPAEKKAVASKKKAVRKTTAKKQAPKKASSKKAPNRKKTVSKKKASLKKTAAKQTLKKKTKTAKKPAVKKRGRR